MSAESTADLVAIHDLLIRYATAIDDRDLASVGECFTEDATAEYGGQHLGPGRDDIVHFLSAALTSEASTHGMCNISISLLDSGATSQSDAVVHHVSGETLIVRGVRYHDRLVRRSAGWRISHRRHEARWTSETGGRSIS